jgi:hypothetical protein
MVILDEPQHFWHFWPFSKGFSTLKKGLSWLSLVVRTSVRAQSLAFKGGLFCHCTTPGMVDSDLGRPGRQGSEFDISWLI